jgi:succinoglycan biosynthesis transport protein ExoP
MKNLPSSNHSSGEFLPVPAEVSGSVVTADGYWAGGEPSSEEKGSTQGAKLRRYWAAIKRFRWLVGILVVLGTAAGIVATRFIKPMYEAHGAVWISDVNPRGNNSGNPARAPELLPTGSWVELFRSFAVVDRLVAKKRLFIKYKDWQDSAALATLQPTPRMAAGLYTLSIDPTGTRYTLTEDKLGVIEEGKIGDSIGRRVGFLWAPSPEALKGRSVVTFTINQPRSVAVYLIERLSISMQENSNFLKLVLSGPDKWQTADLLNTWMQEFVATAAELRTRNMSDVARILATQREAAQAGLRQAEQELQTFRSRAITEPSEGAITAASSMAGSSSDVLATAFFKNLSDYESIRRDREALQALAEAARSGNISPDAINAIPAVAQAPSLAGAARELLEKETQLRTLRQTYTDEYKPVKDLIENIRVLRTQTIPTLAQNAADVLRRQEMQLASRLRRDSVQLRGVPQRSIEEARLRRNLEIAENLFTTLENRYEATRLSAVSTVPDVNILDPALPAAAPARNMKLLLVVGGFGASLALGIALALLLDMVDRRFRYPEQIADELNLQVIGAIPAVPKPGDAIKDPEAMLHSVEAFRGLRMQIHHAFSAPPVQLTISSPGAGDGKSMIASNLALSFAEAGFRTLLIDGDIRRGKLHAIFGLDRRPGLLDYLAGQADLSSIIREAPTHPRLSVIPSGTRRHRGPELLTSALLPTLFNTLRPRYDAIIVDSAPLGAGIDAYAFGVATGTMAIVMRTGVTDRRMAKAKVNLLERFPVRVLGAIVNDVPAAGLYQEYSYLYGYSPDSDAEAEDQDIPVLRPAPTGAESNSDAVVTP